MEDICDKVVQALSEFHHPGAVSLRAWLTAGDRHHSHCPRRRRVFEKIRREIAQNGIAILA